MTDLRDCYSRVTNEIVARRAADYLHGLQPKKPGAVVEIVNDGVEP